MDPSTEKWLGDLGLSQHKAMLEAAGLTDAAGFGIAPQCLNDLLKEAGLPLPARAKILANAHPPDEDGIRMVSAVDATTTHYWPVGVAVGLLLVLVPCCVLYYFHRQHTSKLTPHASQRLAAVIGLVLFVWCSRYSSRRRTTSSPSTSWRSGAGASTSRRSSRRI